VKVTGTAVQESANEEKEEQDEHHESGEHEAANLRLSKIEHLSATANEMS
jgi:hypothetical protein